MGVSQALLLALLSYSCFAEVKEEDGVLVLTKDTFKDAINSNEYILVEFYAPWCGHCKALAPEYAKAAQMLAEEGSVIKLAKVDATAENELASEHGVQGYPTLKYFRKGVPKDYGGGRDAAAIVDWCKSKMGVALKQLPTLDEAKDFIQSRDVAIVTFLKSEDSSAKAIIERLADGMDDMSFASTSSPEVFKEYGIEKDNSIVMFKKFDDEKTVYEGELAEDALKAFCERESIRLVSEFNQATSYKIFSSPIKKHLIAFLSKKDHYGSHFDKLTPVAKKFKGKLHVIVVDIDLEDHSRILEFFGMEKSEVPAYRLINLAEEMQKFKPQTDDFTLDTISQFVEAGLNDELTPFMMSQTLPEDWNANPVKVLVGTNFNEVVKDKSKAVFVELYAPWCGHCKALAPVWEDLAEAFKDSKDVIIAKMDATANEVEGLKIGSFPTLKYYPKNSDEVIDYSGDRGLEALKQFVQSEGKVVKKGKDEDEDEAESDHVKDEL